MLWLLLAAAVAADLAREKHPGAAVAEQGALTAPMMSVPQA